MARTRDRRGPAAGKISVARKQRIGAAGVIRDMDSDAAVHPGRMARRRTQHGPQPPPGADISVTALYQAHALGLIRLAYLMLGERRAASGKRPRT